jgi:hypothetical protein
VPWAGCCDARPAFFEFIPQFKLVVAGNHKPSIRTIDEAMRRRLHLVPFTVTIPPKRRDKTLPERLLAERDGVLAWAVQGCVEWQRIGLQPPAAVMAATEEYFEAEDICAPRCPVCPGRCQAAPGALGACPLSRCPWLPLARRRRVFERGATAVQIVLRSSMGIIVRLPLLSRAQEIAQSLKAAGDMHVPDRGANPSDLKPLLPHFHGSGRPPVRIGISRLAARLLSALPSPGSTATTHAPWTSRTSATSSWASSSTAMGMPRTWRPTR